MKNTSLKFLVFPTESVADDSAQVIAQKITFAQQGKKSMFLLLSGGSSITMYAKIFSFLPAQIDLSFLTVGLCDERFGPMGHLDSNEEQLRIAGVIPEFEKRGAQFVGILQPNQNGVKTAEIAGERYASLYQTSHFILIVAGMGPDGHTHGWLPTQTLEKFMTLYGGEHLITYYEVDPKDSPNPHTKRLTTTLRATKEATEVVLYAKGNEKKPALEKLKMKKEAWNVAPVVALRELAASLCVLTDQQI